MILVRVHFISSVHKTFVLRNYWSPLFSFALLRSDYLTMINYIIKIMFHVYPHTRTNNYKTILVSIIIPGEWLMKKNNQIIITVVLGHTVWKRVSKKTTSTHKFAPEHIINSVWRGNSCWWEKIISGVVSGNSIQTGNASVLCFGFGPISNFNLFR